MPKNSHVCNTVFFHEIKPMQLIEVLEHFGTNAMRCWKLLYMTELNMACKLDALKCKSCPAPPNGTRVSSFDALPSTLSFVSKCKSFTPGQWVYRLYMIPYISHFFLNKDYTDLQSINVQRLMISNDRLAPRIGEEMDPPGRASLTSSFRNPRRIPSSTWQRRFHSVQIRRLDQFRSAWM